MHYQYRRLCDGRQAVLRETRRAVTPFGGLAVFVEFVRGLKLLEAVRQHLPFAYHSNHAMAPEHTLLAFWLGVVTGARRFAHCQLLRYDRALQELCGVRAFPSDDTIRNFFRRFGPGEVARFFPPLWQWLLRQQPARAVLLDLDSTVFQRYGRQEGAERGYNPTRRHGRTHHPLLAFITAPVLVLHGWLRAGAAADNRGAVEFLQEALGLLPPSWSVAGVRADGGFFDQKVLQFLEDRQLPYLMVVRLHRAICQQVCYVPAWTALDATHAVGEFTLRLPTWTVARRFVVLRLQLPEPKARQLIAVPGYEFRIFVTNRTEAPSWLWRHYDARAAIEPRFSELKQDLAADDFCLRGFFPTEAAVRSVFFAFNLLSLLQAFAPKTAGRPTAQLRPATLRSTLFLCGAIAGRAGHKTVLFLAQSWGGLTARKPLLDKLAAWQTSTAPKLDFDPAPAPT